MITGRKPKPHALKVLTGTAKRRAVTPLRRRLSGLCGHERPDGSPCRLLAGWGTEHKGVGPCRHHEGSPESASAVPQPPGHLPPHAREFWEALAPQLHMSDRLRAEDVPMFTILCRAHYFELYAAALLMKEGIVALDAAHKDVSRKHPAWQMWRDGANVVRQYSAEFGITPSSRTRLELPDGLEDGGDDDPWQKL